MKFETLTSSLKLEGDQIRIKADTLRDDKLSAVILKPFYGDDTLTITGRLPGEQPIITPDAHANKLVIEGQATFPFLRLDDPSAIPAIRATFELKDIDQNGEGMLTVTLKYFLPKTWRFQRSFPKLPIVLDLKTGFDGEQTSILDRLKFPEIETNDHRNLDACFVLATDSIEDDGYNVTLDPGLNFVGRWDATGMLGVLENLLPDISKQLVLFGPIVFPASAKTETLPAGQFAWDVKPIVPGIHLQANLNITPTFGKTFQFGEVLCRLYSPVTSEWLAGNTVYQPVMAYLCEIRVPSANDMKSTLLAKKQLGEDNLLVAAQFQGVNVSNLFTLLTEVAQGDFTSTIPSEEVIRYLKSSGDLELETTAAMLVPRGSSYRVAYTYFTLGMPHLNWVLFKDILEIDSLWTEIIVFNPFETDQSSSISGTIIGKAILLGFRLQVTIQLPDLFISAEQIEAKTVPLKELFEKFLPEIPAPADLIIDRLLVVAKPGAYYTFSMSIAGDPPWTINLGKESTQSLVIQDIEFSLSKDVGITGSIAAVLKFEKLAPPATRGGKNQDVELFISATVPISSKAGWQFEGSTGPGQEIPIGNLIIWLGEKFGATPPPSAVTKLLIKNLRISFNTQSKDFTFTIETKFPVDGQELDMVLDIEIKHQQDGSYSKHFSGKVTVEEMEFDVIFDSNENATALLAAYNNPKGKSVPIRPMVAKLSSTIAGEIPESLSFTVRDALLAYLTTTDPAKVEESKYLFGIGIDGGLNLSDLRLPDLPLVGPLFPPDQTLKLSFKLLAKLPDGISFSLNDVSFVNRLLTSGPKLPNKAIDAKLDLVTVLQIGQESKSLELQIGVNKESLPPPTPPGATEPPKNTGMEQANPGNKAIVPSTAPSAANVQSADGMQWITIQKSFGPVNFERLGLAYKDGSVTGALDASLMAGGLTIALNGLSVTSSLTEFRPVFDLHGLGIDYRNDTLEIGGAFLKQRMKTRDGKEYTGFGGLAVIRTQKLTISAIGSYAKIKDDQQNEHSSLFIYAILDYPIGGPAFFYITGLAAGFGYNRGLDIPTIETLDKFPLIADALPGAGSQQLPAGQQQQQTTLETKLASLETYIPPAVGENFLAVGIKFTSFKIIESFALLTVKFGGRLEFDLLGLSTLVSPPAEASKSVPPVAKATLALKATFLPDDGFLGVQAQLTSDSFVLSQACHLTGGFAFFSWFKDSADGKVKAGDFVLTLGGYHPKYVVPNHYPRVPALGINWQVNKPGDPFELSIKGDAYFALTPQALMAGGHLEVLWHMDSLRAWLKAGADFLIYWKPYHYDARMYVEIGASYTFDLFGSHTITVDLGADLHLWGPEFAGTVELHCYIFSVKVEFGDQTTQRVLPIDWNTFRTSFLPEDEQICTVAVQGGLIRQVEEAGTQRWIVNPKDLVIATNSVIPSNQARAGDGPWGELLKMDQEPGTSLMWAHDAAGKRISPLPFSSAITRNELDEFLIDQKVIKQQADADEWLRNFDTNAPKIETGALKEFLQKHSAGEEKAGQQPWEVLKDALKMHQRDASRPPEPTGPLYIAPMGVDKPEALDSAHMITVTKDGASSSVADQFSYLPVLKALPAAMWGKPQMENGSLTPLDVNAKTRFVEDTVAGFEIRPKPPESQPEEPRSIDLANFAYDLESIEGAYEFSRQPDRILSYLQGDAAWNQADNDVGDVISEEAKNARTRRQTILDALGFSTRMLDFGESVNEDVMIQDVSA